MKEKSAETKATEKSGATKKLTLKPAVFWGDGENQEEVKVLEFGELLAGDLEDLAMPFSVGDYLRMGSRSAGVPYALMRKLSPTDALLVVQVMESFFDAGRLIGSP